MNKPICLLGNGSQANEAESYLTSDLIVGCRAVSRQYIKDSDSTLVDIQNPPTRYKALPAVAAVGTPDLRRELINTWPGKEYINVISDRAYIGEGVVIGAGSIIAPHATITTNVNIGNHVIINIGATISHDCVIGDFVTISPGVNIAGNVELGNGVFVGIGAVISNGIKIATGCVIGAGAAIIHDITEPNSVVVGVPGKVHKTNEGWLREI